MIDQNVFNSRKDVAYMRALVNAMTVAPTLGAVEGLLLDLKSFVSVMLDRVLEAQDNE